jgi:hypothetical protein
MKFRYPSELKREAARRLKRLQKTGDATPKQRSSDLADLTDEELLARLDEATKKDSQRICNELARRLTR